MRKDLPFTDIIWQKFIKEPESVNEIDYLLNADRPAGPFWPVAVILAVLFIFFMLAVVGIIPAIP